MSYVLVFCTADISPEIWEDFVVSSQRPRDAPKMNTWILIRSPSNESPFGLSVTDPPIEPFSTGFKIMAIPEIQAYFRDLEDKTRANIDASVFVVLDKRSLEDRTAVVNDLVQKFDDVKLLSEEWRQSRLKFEAAWALTSVLGTKPGLIDHKQDLDKIYEGPYPLQLDDCTSTRIQLQNTLRK